MQKGLTGLAKDRLLDEHVDLPLTISYGELMFARGSTFTVKAVDMVSQLMTFQFQLTQDFTMNYLGREGASTPFENPPPVTFFVGKVITIAMVPWWMRSRRCDSMANAGKCPWQSHIWSEKFELFDESHLETENISMTGYSCAPGQTLSGWGGTYLGRHITSRDT